MEYRIRLKILFILHLPPPIHGPAVIGEYIKQSTLINSEIDCSYINLSISSSLVDIGTKSYSKLFRFLKLIWQVKKQLIFNRPDLCYITLNSKGSGFYKDSLIALVVRFFGVKRIYHFHNKGITDHKLNFFGDFIYKIVFHKADVILISDRLYYDFEKYVPQDKVHYCTNGIPWINPPLTPPSRGTGRMEPATSNQQPATISEKTHDAGLRTHGAINGICNLLFFSNLFESKGLIILLDACKLLKEKNLNFHCTISGGEGDFKVSSLLSLIDKMELSDCVSYISMKKGFKKDDLFSHTDIFVHPSYFDCLPLVILEAMENSLPVVSTFEGAIPDAVEDGVTGYLVPVKDPVALAEKLELLINDPSLRKKMGEEGRARYEQKFRLEIFENRLTEILTIAGNP